MVSKNHKIFLAGHKGHLGSAIFKKLKKAGFTNILTINKSKLNLLNQEKVFKFLKKKKTQSSNSCCSKGWRHTSK